jgi:hypothetical protein
MRERSLLFNIFGLIVVIAILHFLGLFFYLYWRVPEYDRLLHFLGGLWIACVILSLLSKNILSPTRKQYVFIAGILSALVVGILWELFELKTGVTILTDKGYGIDTVGDIISDVVGGIVGSFYIIHRYKHRENNLSINTRTDL